MIRLQGILVLLAASCQAHFILRWPPALRSKYNPATPPALIDYNLMAPLTSNPSNFPCKGYQTNTPLVDSTTYQAGSTYNVTLQGTAMHGGGSCQLSLSYDNGKTFKVIKSIIGGCPLKLTYDFTIPAVAPTGDALFAWSWTNYMGNREFYMNCATVHVNSATTSPEQFNALPNIWVANLASVNKCSTNAPNGALNVVYPDPGEDVEYGNGMTKSSPPTTGDCEVPVQARFAAAPSFSYDPVTSTTTTSEAAAASDDSPAFAFDPVITTTTTSSAILQTTTTSSVLFSITFSASSTTTAPSISPIQASGTTAMSTSSSTPYSSLTGLNASMPVSSPTVSTTTLTVDCPSTIVVTLPPTSYIATYTVSSTASACTGTAVICPCADQYACMAIGDCTWECMAVSTPTGMSFVTSVTSSTSTPPVAASSTQASSTTQSPPLAVTSSTQPVPSAPASTPGYVVPAALSSYLPCVAGTFICTDPSTWYTCIAGADGTTSYQFPRSVAAGMQCQPNLTPGTAVVQGNTPAGYYRDDQYVAARPYGSCPVDGALQCTNGGQGFQVCDHGGWIDMGPVAAGTKCVNGQIVSA